MKVHSLIALLAIVLSTSNVFASLARLEGEDLEPVNKVYVFDIADERVLSSRSFELSATNFLYNVEPPERKNETREEEAPSRTDTFLKIEPRLRKQLEAGSFVNENIEVIVSFAEEVIVPSFKSLNRTAISQRTYLANAEAKVRQIQNFRSERFPEKQAILDRVSARLSSTFWLINAAQISIPAGNLRDLAAYDQVRRIELASSDDSNPPPQNSNNNDDVQDGRAWIRSDPYRATGSGFIGLLDTGVRPTHNLLNTPDRIDFIRDCTQGVANCVAAGGDTDCWNHGTSTAAIIVGSAASGDAFRGVTDIILDSWKVYPNPGGCANKQGLNTAATLRAFEQATIWDSVIVAEMQSSQDETGSIAEAADAAFDAGRIVIAANGNTDAVSTVASPANAHKAIGVGSFDVESGNPTGTQAAGPTRDGRTKPDIRTPTNTETASASSDSAFRKFSGTSGATPYAGAAAALLRSWFLQASGTVPDAGSVYASLIAYTDAATYDNNNGAGRLRLGTNGFLWRGRVTLTSNKQAIDINISPSRTGAGTIITAALWWPEINFWLIDIHNDIDLHVFDPNGSLIRASVGVKGVFEKILINNPIPGTYKVRIYAYNLMVDQTVYYAINNQLL